MPVDYPNLELLHEDDFAGGFAAWHHEGIGTIGAGAGGAMRLHCIGSRQGAAGCMAFFRPTLPDQVAIEYTVTILSQGGLMINYLACRGLHGEDLIADRDRLPPRTGIMRNYWDAAFGLQSYHVSVSRFNDQGEHTRTSNWRRNPGTMLVGHGTDPMTQLGRPYRVRVTKDRGHCQFYVDGQFAHACLDRDISRLPVPDYGKFGFRLIGADVAAEIADFRVYRIASDPETWKIRGL
jgi:hypothetical protein